MNREIGALTGLRGIAAIWVLLFHLILILRTLPPELQIPFRYVATAGYLGVDIFFVLSGFVIAYNYAGRGLHCVASAWLTFLWKRLARIYPVHLAGLALVAVLMLAHGACRVLYIYGGDTSLAAMAKSALMIHAWTLSIEPSWNLASWSVSAEWLAYLCFPVLAAMAERIRSRVLALCAITLLFSGLFLLVHNTEWGDSLAYGLPRIAVEFTSGVFLWRLYKLGADLSPRGADFIAMVALAGLVTVSSASDMHAQKLVYSLQAMPVLAAFVIYSLAFARGPLQRFLCSAPMQYLGRISYSLYIVHFGFFLLAHNVVVQRWFFVNSTPLTLTAAALALLCSFGCAHWFYVSIEEPSRRAMLELLTRKRVEAPGLVHHG